jgi:hypothetical protein
MQRKGKGQGRPPPRSSRRRRRRARSRSRLTRSSRSATGSSRLTTSISAPARTGHVGVVGLAPAVVGVHRALADAVAVATFGFHPVAAELLRLTAARQGRRRAREAVRVLRPAAAEPAEDWPAAAPAHSQSRHHCNRACVRIRLRLCPRLLAQYRPTRGVRQPRAGSCGRRDAHVVPVRAGDLGVAGARVIDGV